MDYMSYEATLPIIAKTFFDGFKFYSREVVEHAIHTLPDDLPHPPGFDPNKPQPRPIHYNGSKMTPGEVARMNKVVSAKTLLLGDTRKAQAVCDFVKTMFLKELTPVTDRTKENCLFEAWLCQISNADFIYSNDTGNLYSPLDLRYQLLYNMAVDYKLYTAKVYMHLEKPYKRWCLEQLDEDCPSDLATVAALRHMFQVRNIQYSIPNSVFLYIIPCVIPNETCERT